MYPYIISYLFTADGFLDKQELLREEIREQLILSDNLIGVKTA